MKKVLFTSIFILWVITSFYTKAQTWPIYVDPETKKIYILTGFFQNTWNNIWNNDEDTVKTWTNHQNNSEEENISTWNDKPDYKEILWKMTTWTSDEFHEALAWMYINWLTMYDNDIDYRPNDFLSREEASKIIWQLYNVLKYPNIIKNKSCNFSDINTMDPTLSWFVQQTCRNWLFKWYKNKFMPHNQITKSQVMAVLIRMLEWKISYEWWKIWRERYYIKWRKIWLIETWTMDTFDNSITRKEVAIFVYRLKNIVQNEQVKKISLNTMQQVDIQEDLSEKEITDTNNVDNTKWTNDLDSTLSALNNEMFLKDPELIDAIWRMYDKWLTIYKDVKKFEPFNVLHRWESAKFLFKFSESLNLWNISWSENNNCIFVDIENQPSDIQNYIKWVCEKWILIWSNWTFNPNAKIKKSEFITALIRLIEWKKLNENIKPRWTNYYAKALDLWIVWPADSLSFDNSLTRYEWALFLYRFNNKYLLLHNLNSNKMQNEIIKTIEWSQQWNSANVYVDVSKIGSDSFSVWYIDIMWKTYEIEKSDLKTYFEWNFVWYWNLFDLDTDQKVWIISLMVSNNLLVEWNIRFNNSDNYKISQLQDTNAYYKIEKL